MRINYIKSKKSKKVPKSFPIKCVAFSKNKTLNLICVAFKFYYVSANFAKLS